MAEEERRAVDNVALLRALADQAMQENGLADAQGAAAVSVVPSTATAAAVGMDIGTPRYEAAVGRLLEAGALERDEERTGSTPTSRESPRPSESRAAASTCCERSDSWVAIRLQNKRPGNESGPHVLPANEKVTDGARTRDLRSLPPAAGSEPRRL